MACTKPYGLRRVWIAPVTGTNTGVFYETVVSSIEMPKVYSEHTEIDESSGLRGGSAYVEGNLGELSGTITITAPKTTFFSNHGLMALFAAAGFTSSGAPMTPKNSGACETTCKIYTLDRTGLFAELLEGVIVTSIDFTLNRSDVPTISFAFTAAKKLEFMGSRSCSDFTTDDETIYSTTAGTLACGDSDLFLSYGEIPVTIGGTEAAQVTAKAGSQLTITRSDPVAHSGAVEVLPAEPVSATPQAQKDYSTNHSWGLSGAETLKVQSCSLSISTGLSYGELLVDHRYLSEILAGTLAVTGSITCYFDDGAAALAANNLNQDQSLDIILGNVGITLNRVAFTEPPDLSLAKGEPASGDFAFTAYCSNGFDLISFAGHSPVVPQ